MNNENPQNSNIQLDSQRPKHRPSRVLAAQQCSALRKFHYIFSFGGFLLLMLALAQFVGNDREVEDLTNLAVQQAEHKVSRSERAAIESGIVSSFHATGWGMVVQGAFLLGCGLFVFHHPLRITVVTFSLYLITTIILILTSIMGDIPGWLLIGRGLVLVPLLMAVIAASRFQTAFERENQ